MHDLSRTLAAIASAPGRGGVGCVRISGPNAYAIARTIFSSRRRLDLPGNGRPRFGCFLDDQGRPLDHGYLVAFPAARAYTGEPTVELWSHGSPPVLDALTRAAVVRGAVLAGPGEFSYRALRRGRLDLARAEAVRDLISARTIYQARVAFAQLDGALSRRLAPLREGLVELMARGEAAIEFADEAETHLPAGGLAKGVVTTLAMGQTLLEEARRGRVVREGARVALVGATSVGKSTLFNRLLGKDRAIVSPIAGTTRDTLEETLDLHGIPITLIDTAGVRTAGDDLEAEGVRRARAAAAEADLVVIVLDAGRDPREDEQQAVDEHELRHPARTIVVANKVDLLPEGAHPLSSLRAIPLSARTGDGVDALQEAIRSTLCGAITEDHVLTNARHAVALEATVTALARARDALPLGEEIVLEELRTASAALGEIVGEVGNEDLYDRIFSTFCIGK